ncbi:Uncharacterised protein r2_g3591 [Pycnogonum litorale]
MFTFCSNSSVDVSKRCLVTKRLTFSKMEHLPTTTQLLRDRSLYHVRAYLEAAFPNRWIGRRGSIEFPARSPGLTPTDFFLCGYLKNKVYGSKPATVDELKEEIERQCLGSSK